MQDYIHVEAYEFPRSGQVIHEKVNIKATLVVLDYMYVLTSSKFLFSKSGKSLCFPIFRRKYV